MGFQGEVLWLVMVQIYLLSVYYSLFFFFLLQLISSDAARIDG